MYQQSQANKHAIQKNMEKCVVPALMISNGPEWRHVWHSCQGQILIHYAAWSWTKEEKDIDDSTFRHPMNVDLKKKENDFVNHKF